MSLYVIFIIFSRSVEHFFIVCLFLSMTPSQYIELKVGIHMGRMSQRCLFILLIPIKMIGLHALS